MADNGADSKDGMPEQVGGRYRILGRLGKGAMGVVFTAHDPVLDRRVAIKQMTPGIAQNEELRQRFFVEARAAAQLNHPNIITIHELAVTGTEIFIVMELLEGKSLADIVKGRSAPLPVDTVLDVMAQVCDGLDYAHGRSIVHRDIKPANLFLLSATGAVKILDFGIARVGSMQLTAIGAVLGTPDYMAPEQVRGDTIDRRTDLWAVGAVLYELLSGTKPFDAKPLAKLLAAITQAPHVPLQQRAPSVPWELCDLVERLLAKPKDQRPATAGMVRDELRAILARDSGAPRWDANRAADLSETLVLPTAGRAEPPRPPAASAPVPVAPSESPALVDTAPLTAAHQGPPPPPPAEPAAAPPPAGASLVRSGGSAATQPGTVSHVAATAPPPLPSAQGTPVPPAPAVPAPPMPAAPAPPVPAAPAPPVVGPPVPPPAAAPPAKPAAPPVMAVPPPVPAPQGGVPRQAAQVSPPSPARRKTAVLGLVAIVVAMLVVGGGGLAWWYFRTGGGALLSWLPGRGGVAPATPAAGDAGQTGAQASGATPGALPAGTPAPPEQPAAPGQPVTTQADATQPPGVGQPVESARPPAAMGQPFPGRGDAMPAETRPAQPPGEPRPTEARPVPPPPPEPLPAVRTVTAPAPESRNDEPRRAEPRRQAAPLTPETVDALTGRRGSGLATDPGGGAGRIAAVNRITYVLEQYAQALERHDTDGLRQLRSRIGAAETRWLEAKTLKVVLDTIHVDVDGTEAVARCRRTVQGVSASGQPISEQGPAEFHLIRRPAGWVITDVR